MIELTPEQKATAAAVERALAELPIGATLREAERAALVAPTRARVTWDGVIPPKGAYGCKRCGCAIEHPGACDACGTEWRRSVARAEFAKALDSIPKAYRWAAADAPNLASVCGEFLRGLDARAMVKQIAASIIARKFVVYTLLDERSGAGKSSFACAVVREVIETAVRALCDAPPHELGQKEPDVATLARGARFVSATELIRSWGDGDDAPPPAYERARMATLLILDDSGQQEERRRDAAGASARGSAITRLMVDRWNRDAITLLTTYAPFQLACKMYGGGIARRLYQDDRRTCVIPSNEREAKR